LNLDKEKLTVNALLVAATLYCAPYTSYKFLPGNPYSVPGKERNFAYNLPAGGSSSREHPFLWVSRAEIVKARNRREPWAVSERKALLKEAEEALRSLDFTSPSESWYEPLRGKPFDSIYPQVYKHTAKEPYRTWQRGLALARAWAVTGKKAYSEAVVRLLRSWSSYPFGVEHYDAGLNYAVWAIMTLECYDLLYGELTKNDHASLAHFFERCLGAIMKNDCFWIENNIGGGLNNHLAWHKYAACAIALFYGKEEILRFVKKGARSITELAERGLRDQGIWIEGSIPYHLTAQYPLVAAAYLLRRSQGELSPFANGYTIRDFSSGIYKLVLPDLTLPPLGDAYGLRRFLPDSAPWEFLPEPQKDSLAGAMLPRRRRSDPWVELLTGLHRKGKDAPPLPPLHSELFSEHGYVVLRWPEGPPDPQNWTILATYDASGVHCHADKLSFMLFARGRLWLEDREAIATSVHAFSSEIQRTLNRHSICHNTLVVDWKNQRHVKRKLQILGFVRSSDHVRTTIADLEGLLYPGVKQLRSLLLTPNFALDILCASSVKPSLFILPLHVAGTPQPQSMKGEAVKLPQGKPWSWLRRARKVAKGRKMSFVFTDREGRSFRIIGYSSVPGEVWLVDFPQDDKGRRYSNVVLQVRRSKRVIFLHLFTFMDPVPSITCRELLTDGLIEVTVKEPGRQPKRYLLPLLR